MDVKLDKWHKCKIDKEILKELSQKSDLKGFQHVSVFFGLLILIGTIAYITWGTWWSVFWFLVYGNIYSFSNPLWHETGHKTAFKSKYLGEPFNFGPDSKSVITVLEIIKKLSNKWFNNENNDFFSIQKSDLKEANLLQLDCQKAYNKLGWKSIIDTGDLVNLTINWYKSFYENEDVEELSIKQILYYNELGIKNNQEWVK